MNAQSWAHVSSIVGSVLLSLQLFRSNQEEEDAAATWWNGNPFQRGWPLAVRKALGFTGLILLILGFAIDLALSLGKPTLDRHAQAWFIAAVVTASILLVWIGYVLAGHEYRRRRIRHFARIASKALDAASADKINHLQLFNALRSIAHEMPARYTEVLTDSYEVQALEQIRCADGKTADPVWLSRGIVLRPKDATTEEGFALIRYIVDARE